MKFYLCSTCGYGATNPFFSSYVLHLVKEDEEDQLVPYFCGQTCMLRWISIRKRKPLSFVEKDFNNYCRAR